MVPELCRRGEGRRQLRAAVSRRPAHGCTPSGTPDKPTQRPGEATGPRVQDGQEPGSAGAQSLGPGLCDRPRSSFPDCHRWVRDPCPTLVRGSGIRWAVKATLLFLVHPHTAHQKPRPRPGRELPPACWVSGGRSSENSPHHTHTHTHVYTETLAHRRGHRPSALVAPPVGVTGSCLGGLFRPSQTHGLGRGALKGSPCPPPRPPAGPGDAEAGALQVRSPSGAWLHSRPARGPSPAPAWPRTVQGHSPATSGPRRPVRKGGW